MERRMPSPVHDQESRIDECTGGVQDQIHETILDRLLVLALQG